MGGSKESLLRHTAKKTLWYIGITISAMPFLLPFFWMLSCAFKTPDQIFAFPIQWFPKTLTIKNFIVGWTVLPFNIFLANTTIITLFCMLGEGLMSSLVAYGFARIRFKGRDFLFLVLLATMMFPPQIVIIPLFILFAKLNWINTFYSLIVPCYFMGFGRGFLVFLLRQFYLGIPLHLEDAARIDGASSFTIWLRIILPLSKPALATVLIFSFMFHWNDFFYPLIFLNDTNKKTISLGLSLFKDQYATMWGEAMAVATLAIIPCIVIFLLFQRYFISGIALSGVKG